MRGCLLGLLGPWWVVVRVVRGVERGGGGVDVDVDVGIVEGR